MKEKTKKHLRVIGMLTLIRSILKGKKDKNLKVTEVLTMSSKDEIEFTWKLNFCDNDIVWLQNLSEEKIEAIIKDAKNLIKKYCPENWS